MNVSPHNRREGDSDRQCGSCSQCCRLLRIEALSKPPGRWCKHCSPGHNACAIYEVRPDECAEFLCAWRERVELGPEWFPHRAKLVVVSDSGNNRIAIHVDPITPQRWREEPYYNQIKQWATRAADNHGQVIVYINDRAVVVLPNKEIDLGSFRATDHVVVSETRGPLGRDWHAYVVPAEQIPVGERDRLITKRLAVAKFDMLPPAPLMDIALPGGRG
jgi:Fe-S-cluster containining protein